MSSLPEAMNEVLNKIDELESITTPASVNGLNVQTVSFLIIVN